MGRWVASTLRANLWRRQLWSAVLRVFRFQAKPFRNLLLNALPFVGRQLSEPSFQVNDGDGLDLLQVERPGFQERLRNREFPMVAPQCRGVRQDCDQRQFIIRRIACEQQTRPGLPREVMVPRFTMRQRLTRHRPMSHPFAHSPIRPFAHSPIHPFTHSPTNHLILPPPLSGLNQ